MSMIMRLTGQRITGFLRTPILQSHSGNTLKSFTNCQLSHKLLKAEVNLKGCFQNELIFRGFKTSAPRNIPPIVLLLAKPVSRLFAALFGRRVRTWWKALPSEKKAKFQQTLRHKKAFLGGFAAVLLSFAGYGYYSHIQECPITKRRRFVALTKDQVEKLAEIEFKELGETYARSIMPAEHPFYTRIVRVAQKILTSNQDLEEISKKNWTITVIDERDRNAFVLPSGHIFVFTGMLKICSNDDQLGVVLSHEIAHTLLGHSGENLSYLNLLSAVLMIPLAVLWAFLPNDGIALVADWFFHKATKLLFELPFSRDMETEADEVGLMLAAKACFDIREAPAFWAKMELIEKEEDPNHKPPIELLSTHPSSKHREGYLASLLPNAFKIRTSCDCPKLPNSDPYEEFKKNLASIKAQLVDQAKASIPEIIKEPSHVAIVVGK